MTRTLILDLDGTLVDSVDDLAASLNTVLRARALPPTEDQKIASATSRSRMENYKSQSYDSPALADP